MGLLPWPSASLVAAPKTARAELAALRAAQTAAPSPVLVATPRQASRPKSNSSPQPAARAVEARAPAQREPFWLFPAFRSLKAGELAGAIGQDARLSAVEQGRESARPVRQLARLQGPPRRSLGGERIAAAFSLVTFFFAGEKESNSPAGETKTYSKRKLTSKKRPPQAITGKLVEGVGVRPDSDT